MIHVKLHFWCFYYATRKHFPPSPGTAYNFLWVWAEKKKCFCVHFRNSFEKFPDRKHKEFYSNKYGKKSEEIAQELNNNFSFPFFFFIYFGKQFSLTSFIMRFGLQAIKCFLLLIKTETLSSGHSNLYFCSLSMDSKRLQHFPSFRREKSSSSCRFTSCKKLSGRPCKGLTTSKKKKNNISR